MSFGVVRNLNRVGFRNFRSFHKSLKRAAEPPKESSGCESEKKPEKTEKDCGKTENKPEKKPEKSEKDCEKIEKPPCPPEPPSPPPEPPCPPKAPEPPPKAAAKTPQPPPCPAMPQCPPTLCPPFPDPNNPCNYTPPPCVDPENPDLSRLKGNQCKYQADDDIPVFLKRGTVDVIAFQTTLVLIVGSLGYFIYVTLK